MKIPFLVYFSLTLLICNAQKGPDTKFGKITAADLAVTSYEQDTLSEAVVLADIGSTQFKDNKKGWFLMEFRRFTRIHILRRNGYKYANVEIRLFSDGDNEEKLTDVKAVTYNLVDGSIVAEKLDAVSSVFTDKKDKNRIVKKFTLPSVKEGSVIEFEYRITSDFLFNLQPWSFQGAIPSLWSEYKVAMPQFFNYRLIGQGTQSFYLKDQSEKQGSFTVDYTPPASSNYAIGNSEPVRATISCLVTEYRWAMKDIPALREEEYTTSTDNYVSKLEFQLSGYGEPLTGRKITTWLDLTKTLVEGEDFGQGIEKSVTWLKDAVKPVIEGTVTETGKAKKIFMFVRDNFTCTRYNQLYMESTLKKVYDSRNGGIADINLLLTAMLRAAGISADPVMLSTRENGIIYSRYPILSRFNYIITRAVADGKEYFLDAGVPRLGFGKLDYRCYNGDVLVVNESAALIPFRPNEITETKNTDIKFSYDNAGKWKGQCKKIFGYYESLELRNEYSKEGHERLKKLISNSFESNAAIENLQLDSLPMYEEPLAARFDYYYNDEQPDIIYMTPVKGEDFSRNPFKSTMRQYPVELPYRISNTYTSTLTVPDGYRVDEIPKPLTVNIPGGGGSLDYAVKQNGKEIKITYRLEISKTVFQPSEYNDLREFFTKVATKTAEQIVLKKN